MSVTLEQLKAAPVGSRLINTGFKECEVRPNEAQEKFLALKDDDGYNISAYLNEYLATAILANPAVELVTPEPEIKGWKVLENKGNGFMVGFTNECWNALQALLDAMARSATDEFHIDLWRAYGEYRRAERGEK